MNENDSSHETLGLLEASRANNIAIFAFPPHTTHWLCPLDNLKSGFRAFGIYPINPSAIPDTAFLPSDCYDQLPTHQDAFEAISPPSRPTQIAVPSSMSTINIETLGNEVVDVEVGNDGILKRSTSADTHIDVTAECSTHQPHLPNVTTHAFIMLS